MMTRYSLPLGVVLVGFFLSGCTHVCAHMSEPFKKFWGSSTEALEEARKEAEAQSFACSLEKCFDTVLAMTESESLSPYEMHLKKYNEEGKSADGKSAGAGNTNAKSGLENAQEKGIANPDAAAETMKSEDFKKNMKFGLFQASRRHQHIVVMGVPGAVDTTEVGIFFMEEGEGRTRIEVSSLSTNARIMAADIIFSRLKGIFPSEK